MQGDGKITRDEALELIQAAVKEALKGHITDYHFGSGPDKCIMYYYECKKCGDKVESKMVLMHGCYSRDHKGTSRYCGGRYKEITKEEYCG